MKLRELMTADVITAARDDTALSVAQTMRDRGVGSVVVTDAEGDPAGIVTDRDLALRVLADERAADGADRRVRDRAADHAASPRWSSRRPRR